MRLVIGISGATGMIYAIRLLEALQELEVETHVVMSCWAKKNLILETDYIFTDILRLANYYYENTQLEAVIASGSFKTDGMVVMPCSMKSLAAIAVGYSENLLHRAADVIVKERRKLVLVPRETPLSPIHLENMLKLANTGVVIMPPMPAFYHRPASIADIVDHQVGRVLDQFGLENQLIKRWQGQSPSL